MKYILVFFLWLSSFCVYLSADEIVLNDGTKYTGEIQVFTKRFVVVETKDGVIRKNRKLVASHKFDQAKSEEYFKLVEEAGADVEKMFEVALWANKNHKAKYSAALMACLEIDSSFDKAGELLGYKKNASGFWERPKDLNPPQNPKAEDFKKFQQKKGTDSQPTNDSSDEEGDEDREKRLIEKKASSAWKKIEGKFRAKQYEKIKEDLEAIAQEYPDTKEGKEAKDALSRWAFLLEDRELDPIRNLIKISEFSVEQVMFSGQSVAWPELRIEFSLAKDLDELSFSFWACKKSGKNIVLCRSHPKVQVFIDVEKKKGHKLVSTLFTKSIPEFGNEFTWGRYEMLYKGKVLFSGVTKGSEGEWWLTSDGKEAENAFWLGWQKASEASMHQHPWQTNTLWTKEESPKRPGYKPKK